MTLKEPCDAPHGFSPAGGEEGVKPLNFLVFPACISLSLFSEGDLGSHSSAEDHRGGI